MTACTCQAQNTRTTHLCTYSSSQNAVHKYSHSPREHAWLKGQHGSGLRIVVFPKRFRHPSVMSRMLPHLSQNTSTRSLSPTSPIFRPSSPSLSCPLELDQETLGPSFLECVFSTICGTIKNYEPGSLFLGCWEAEMGPGPI